MKKDHRRMRHLLLLSLLVAAFALPAAAATHTSAVNGVEPSPASDGRNQFSLSASGALPGMLSLEVARDAHGNLTGSFTMHVVDAGSENEAGTVKGLISGGSLSARENGFTGSIDVVLTVTSGSGRYDGATGSGSLKVTHAEGALKGTLSLTF